MDLRLEVVGLKCAYDLHKPGVSIKTGNEQSFKWWFAYIKEELSVARLGPWSIWLRQVDSQRWIAHRRLVERRRVELLVARNWYLSDLRIAEKLFYAAECVSEELHRAFIERREMELALDAKYGIEILLRLDVLAQVVSQDPPGTEAGVRNRAEGGLSCAGMIFDLLIVWGLILDEVWKTYLFMPGVMVAAGVHFIIQIHFDY